MVDSEQWTHRGLGAVDGGRWMVDGGWCTVNGGLWIHRRWSVDGGQGGPWVVGCGLRARDMVRGMEAGVQGS